MKNSDIEILKEFGWEVECQSPFEIFHAESCSTATNQAAKIVLEYIKKEASEEETKTIKKFDTPRAASPTPHHFIDQHNDCELCGKPLKVNILRASKCTNPGCKNYYHGKN